MATTEQIKQLREETGAGILDAKRALDENNGDYNKALSILKAKAALVADKKTATRTANSGLVESYLHGEGRIGVLVEINSETDFVARTEEFRQLAHDVALQVAAMSPQYVSPETVPAEVVEQQRKTFEDATRAEGKPEAIAPKIVQGKMDKWFGEVCLYRQPFIRDDSVTIEELVKTVSAKTREKIAVRRFCRFALGE
jgi:elongation factor Ts